MNCLKDYAPFSKPGKFYKGNLHCHSTVSDGNKTPMQLAKEYQRKGYSFIALSEHEKFTRNDDLCSADFITLPTIEWASDLVKFDHDRNELWLKTHHIHGVFDFSNPDCSQNPLLDGEVLAQPNYNEMDGAQTAQEMKEYLKSRGTFCIYNHPTWSKTSFIDYGMLDGFFGMEIYNYSGDVDNCTGDATTQWDYLLDRGAKLFGVATDDNHNGGTLPDDSYGGFICVKAAQLTREAIVTSILAGEFYSSSGVDIYDFEVKDNRVCVRCSGVVRINFISGPCICGGHTIWSQDGRDTLMNAEYEIKPTDKYIRVECVTSDGKKAWSNPIYC